ncbi:CxxxxCH/CxxCH domain-containing protein [Lichenibacterium ramalinae]|uniref:CxxxxCH/CxxCH domain-containing protein n=1 Tax=Lichenibacterium ramalinae TaxID=2316527 RepID=A0A4Q2R9G7_9HYPH|nr:CxxxxCH/CxxCH domain-containing protein [Lichenibacterium ramalinae]
MVQGWSPTVPDRCPLPPRVFWSSPIISSPGPISTRWPSMVSTNHRPVRMAIHCGLGFSCHSPTQPTGRTVKVTPAWHGSILSFHCGATSGLTPLNAKAPSSNRSWRLTPSASV